jgi:hypothetical protein
VRRSIDAVAPSGAGQTPDEPITPRAARAGIVDRLAYAAAFSGGLAWTLILLARSPLGGTPTQDEIAHVLISKHAWNDPQLLLDAWGRPVNTLLYLIPSRFGLTGARLASVVFSALTVVLVTLIVRSLGVKRLYLVPLFLWFQPWFHDFGYAALTPVPFSMLLALSVYAWLRDRPGWAAFVFGLLPLVRWEFLAMLPVAAVLLAVMLRWREIALLASPIAVYLVLGAVAGGDAVSLAEYLRGASPGSYGYGTWSHFFETSAPLIGAPVLVLAALGIPAAARSRRTAGVVAVWAAFFALEVVAWRAGRGAGYVEFVLPVAPVLAIMAAVGTEWLLGRPAGRDGPSRTPAIVRGTIIAGAAVAVLAVGLQTDPRPVDPEAGPMKAAASWLRDHRVQAPTLMSTHAWFQYFYDLPFDTRSGLVDGGRDMPAGTIFVWDRHYSNVRGYPLSVLSDPANGWTRLVVFDGFAAIFRKD